MVRAHPGPWVGGPGPHSGSGVPHGASAQVPLASLHGQDMSVPKAMELIKQSQVTDYLAGLGIDEDTLKTLIASRESGAGTVTPESSAPAKHSAPELAPRADTTGAVEARGKGPRPRDGESLLDAAFREFEENVTA